MKKWCLLLLLLLAACSASDEDNTSASKEPIANKTNDEITDQNFKMTLQSMKDVYKKGEKIEVVATLTNTSDQAIQIGHGESWVAMGTTNLTKNYQYGFAVNEPYVMQYVSPGEAVEDQYRFSGMTYDEILPGEPYSDKNFEQMSSMNFPKGQYEITAFVDFEDSTNEQGYSHELSVIFTVE